MLILFLMLKMYNFFFLEIQFCKISKFVKEMEIVMAYERPNGKSYDGCVFANSSHKRIAFPLSAIHPIIFHFGGVRVRSPPFLGGGGKVTPFLHPPIPMLTVFIQIAPFP